jgi:DNA-binding MarR family transcriptional regulator
MEKDSPNLANALFQLIKQLPRMKLKQDSFEGLTRRERELLVILSLNLDDKRRALSVSEIGGLLQITPAGATHLLNPLEEAGCIERLRNPKDRRVVLIGLTDHGSNIAESLISEINKKLNGLMDYLGEEDSRTLVRLMTKAIDFLAA